MPKAVRFGQYGGIDVLEVVEVPLPEPESGQVLVRVKAAGINPGESKIRSGTMRDIFPATFPSGEGSDLAGVVKQVGPGVGQWSDGDEVIGFSEVRASHAQYAIVEASNLVAKPPGVPWDVAGSLYVVGTTGYAAVRAVGVKPGDVVAVSAAAGGVGSIAVQLAKRAGAEVFGIAAADSRDWLVAHGVTPVEYGEGLADRLRAAAPRIDAFIDTFGEGYVKLALDSGVAADRIDTVVDFAAAQQYGVKTEGNAAAAGSDVLAELVDLVADGSLDVPIAATFPIDEVRGAFELLERGHPRGKVVLIP
jgi:NADPH:quinone reductase-like Zn-dependent oxidoreductase